MNNGVSYELFVQRIQQALFDAQQMSGFKTINVVHNCKLIDKNGVERQFDLYWEFELGGLIYRTIIECKDFESTVPISKVDELVGKLKAFPDIRGIIATRNGFQSGGVKEAAANGIDLIVVRDEDVSKDWIDANGNTLLRSIVVNFNCIVPWRLIEFKPEIDGDWCRAAGVDKLQYQCELKDVIIEDVIKSESRSIEQFVAEYGEKGCNEYKMHFDFVDAYMIAPNNPRCKIKGFDLRYYGEYTLTDSIELRPEVLGVVEYIGKKRKSLVMKHNGCIDVINVSV